MDNKNPTFNDGEHPLCDLADTVKAGGAEVAQQARAAVGDARQAAADTAETVREAGAQLAGHVRSAAGAAKVAAEDGAEVVGHAVHTMARRQRDTVLYWQLCAEDYIQRRPVRAVAAAAGVGLVLGLWLRRPRRVPA